MTLQNKSDQQILSYSWSEETRWDYDVMGV
jgi:hypothetical protein